VVEWESVHERNVGQKYGVVKRCCYGNIGFWGAGKFLEANFTRSFFGVAKFATLVFMGRGLRSLDM
jgi:hypothetical protein